MGRPYKKVLEFYDGECTDEHTYYDLVTKFKKIEEEIDTQGYKQGYKLCLLALIKNGDESYNTFKVIQFDEVLKPHCKGYSNITAHFDGIKIIIHEHHHGGVNTYRLKKIDKQYIDLEYKNINVLNRDTEEITNEIKKIIGVDYIKQLSTSQFENN